MAGLDSFVFNGGATRTFTVTPSAASGSGTNNISVRLANSGIASNSITASNITVGGATASTGNANEGQLFLGLVNQFNTASVALGGFNGSGLVDATTAGASLRLRGTDGTSRTGLLFVGNTSSGTRSGAGTLDLGDGTLDALVTTTYIGNFQANANFTTTSTISMGGGTFDSLSMIMGSITNPAATSIGATINAVFQQNGGTAKIQTLTLGDSLATNNASDPTFLANYGYINLNDPLTRVNGVGSVTIFGAGQYAMRVWVQPDRLATLNITVPEVINAVEAQNNVNPAGQIGAAIDLDRMISRLPQRSGAFAPRRQADLPLGGRATHQYRHLGGCPARHPRHHCPMGPFGPLFLFFRERFAHPHDFPV
jgi:hypothetical protein